MHRHTWAVIGLSLLMTTGCVSASGATRAQQAPPPVGAAPVITRAEQIRLPLDEFALTAAESALVSKAFGRLVTRCAARFDTTATIPAPQNPTAAEMNMRRYGIVDDTHVEELGYGLKGSAEHADESDKKGWDPSPSEDMVLRGAVPPGTTPPTDHDGKSLPAGGCLGETERTLGGNAPLNPGTASMDSFAAAESDARVVEAFAAWSRCMAAAGFEFRSPWEANDAGWPEPAGAEEIRTARQDVACRRDTNLVGIWFTVESAYQRQVIERHSAAFKRLRAWRDGRVEAARRVMAS